MMQSQDPGKEALIQELFVKNSSQMKGFILALLPDFSLADDILHEVFLTLVSKAESFDEGSSFVSWACAVARLKVFEASRARNCHAKMLRPEVIDALAASAPSEHIPDLSSQRLQAIDACLQNLAPRARSIVTMRYREACRPEEIARRLDWTLDSVHVALSKARVALRQCAEQRLRDLGEA